MFVAYEDERGISSAPVLLDVNGTACTITSAGKCVQVTDINGFLFVFHELDKEWEHNAAREVKKRWKIKKTSGRTE